MFLCKSPKTLPCTFLRKSAKFTKGSGLREKSRYPIVGQQRKTAILLKVRKIATISDGSLPHKDTRKSNLFTCSNLVLN